ncbi:uncharacterized protein N7482_005778 [Penicillium canariense]|uniref:Uncharacterized protein n=1 Tax=Penicillium canariense TaxID=189055 RepID=A0A9W9I8N8_9EURO|nr:uncharacterized protein N7482_005778 [Penicillium canariense]KAJ5166997.1 hypothetical protein N7482_005778 [Penicillium canariense]
MFALLEWLETFQGQAGASNFGLIFPRKFVHRMAGGAMPGQAAIPIAPKAESREFKGCEGCEGIGRKDFSKERKGKGRRGWGASMTDALGLLADRLDSGGSPKVA